MKSAKQMAHELVYKFYKCLYCERIVPNFTFLTKNNCIWCDREYWEKKINKENLDNQDKI